MSKSQPSLRAAAEAMLIAEIGQKGPASARSNDQLLHELQVHQIELELQNEELKLAQAKAEAALELVIGGQLSRAVQIDAMLSADRQECRAIVVDITERQGAAEMLRESSQFSAQVITNAQEGIVVYGPDLHYRVWNDHMEKFTGMKSSDVLGRHPLEVFPFLKDSGVMANIEQVLAGGMSTSVEFPFTVEQTGHFGWAMDRNSPLRDASGEIIGVIGTVSDITARRKVEEALKASEQRFRDIVNTTDGLVWEADARTLTNTFMSRQAERLLGYPVEDWLRPGFWADKLHPEDRDWAFAHCTSAIEQGEPFEFEYRFIAHDGRTVWLHDMVTVVLEEGAPCWLRGITVDITAHKQAEQELRDMANLLEHKVVERTAQLRQLAAQLTMAEERERQTLAQDLHDNLGQLLAVIKIKLSSIDAGALESSIANIVDLVSQAEQSVRTVTVRLSPPVLYSLGLVPALEWLGEEIERVYGLKVHVDHDHCRKHLVDEVQAVLFRSVRELLINAAKHARVDEVSLSCMCQCDRLLLVVSDAGCGFDPGAHMDQWSVHQGFGLRSINERICNLGGEMEIDSSPGNGTTITLSVACSSIEREICDDPRNACG